MLVSLITMACCVSPQLHKTRTKCRGSGCSRKAVELSQRQSNTLGTLGYVLAQTGKRSEALQIVEELKARFTKQQAKGGAIGLIYLGLNEKDETFAWLEKDFENRDANMPQTLTQYPLNTLRDEARYKDLRKRMGLRE